MKMVKDLGISIDVAGEFRAAASIAPNKPKKTYPRITLRLTEEENAKLRELSEGMAVSAYIRKCVFGENVARRKRRSHTPVKDQAAMAKALGLLGKMRIANNLNQLAYNANTGSLLVDDETLAQITEAHAHVSFMRRALVQALGLTDGAGK